MPFTFLPHQAAVLPLKLARPRWFSGTALVFGSMAPDLEYFLRGEHTRTIGHTVAGQFLFCLPLTVLLVWIFHRLLAGPLGRHLPEAGEFRLGDFSLLAWGSPRFASLPLIVASALVGSFSHILWDSFTHQSGWMARHIPLLQVRLGEVGHYPLYGWNTLQHLSTLVGGAVTLWFIRRIGSRRLLAAWIGASPEALPPTRAAGWFWPAVLLAGTAAGAGALWNLQRIPALTDTHAWGNVFFQAVAGAYVGLCAACGLASRSAAPDVSGRDQSSGRLGEAALLVAMALLTAAALSAQAR